MLADHLTDSRKLMNMKRYQGKNILFPRSVAEHSWFVSKVAQSLAIWEKKKFGNDVDIEKVMFLAINHDIVEGYTGDIPSPAKNMSTEFRSALENIEEKAFKTQIIPNLPKSWADEYTMLHEEMSKLNSIEARIVKAADLIDRVYECMEEIERHNKKPFESILVNDLIKLKELDLMCSNYFMKYCLKDLEVYEYLTKEIQEELEELDFSNYF